MLKISPSILASDFTRLAEEATNMLCAGADMLHLDVMDGCFVPNITFGQPVIASLRKACPNAYFDTHLMIAHPLRYVEDFVAAGANMIMFHIESESDPADTLAAIRSCGVHAGIALRPGTPAQAVFPFLDKLDMVLAMTVEPGFGGQSFMADMLPKIAAIRGRAAQLGLPGLDIQVDGGIDNATGPRVCASGANVLVAGTSLYGKPDYAAAVSELRAACAL